MKKITLGIIADVDAGKTTLSEALLYRSGSIRSFGRVDKGDSFLDNEVLERRRGITIFSKQARLTFGETDFVLMDTPGHADFSAETERTLSVLDYALLVVSAPEGEKGQTRLLRKLLQEYKVPYFVFFNKMDQVMKNEIAVDSDKEEYLQILNQKKKELVDQWNQTSDHTAVDFSDLDAAKSAEGSIHEQLAVCSENAMEEFFDTGKVSEGTIRTILKDGLMTPCFFGSATQIEGVDELLTALDRFTVPQSYPSDFSAQVYKIGRDADGNRLSFAKITGGSIKVRTPLKDGDSESRITQIRLYSGDRFLPTESVCAGDICTFVGLKKSRAGECLGKQGVGKTPVLNPVLRYRANVDIDPLKALPVFRILEEEIPEIAVSWEESGQEIYLSVMGTVQLEILTSILQERFGMEVSFDSGEVLYKETIASSVIGAGHFEPLRHYAEAHLLLEPLKRGEGLLFESKVSTDRLAKNWQRLILTHLAEKQHKGVLTGSPITDMKITLVAGRAHLKHTEGGDFRQATYRAVRQGLMMAESILLEPFYRFMIELPTENVGRLMTDLDRMNAQFQISGSDAKENISFLEGRGPVDALKDYPAILASYTKNRGEIRFVSDGYGTCHNEKEVIEKKNYDPLADVHNTPDSVFCEGGAGVIVPYDQVYERLDVEFDEIGSSLADPKQKEVQSGKGEYLLSQKEIDSIISAYAFSNTSAKKSTKKRTVMKDSLKEHNFSVEKAGRARSETQMKAARSIRFFPFEQADFLLVDGYNVIFAWEELKSLAKDSIDAARNALIEDLSKYGTMVDAKVIAVFDAYRVKGKAREEMTLQNVRIIFTKEDETADQFIEKFTNVEGKKHRIAVVTSDSAEQQITSGQGCMILSSREFKQRMDTMSKQWNETYKVK